MISFPENNQIAQQLGDIIGGTSGNAWVSIKVRVDVVNGQVVFSMLNGHFKILGDNGVEHGHGRLPPSELIFPLKLTFPQ